MTDFNTQKFWLVFTSTPSNAAISDSVIFEELLSRDIYADRSCATAEHEAPLTVADWRVQIHRKGGANKPISETQKQHNRRIATPRARVEHVFGAMRHMGGKLVRCMGIVSAIFALHLKTAGYKLERLVYLKERNLQAF